MPDEQFQAWNHFVPRLYLKRFAFTPGLIWHYPLLVSHLSVPEWNRLAISKAAAHRHLYTVADDGGESDGIERWLAREFDDPAEEAIERAISGASMTRGHWRRLARFFGAQHARTPAHYLASQQHWQRELPLTMDETLKDIQQDLAAIKEHGELPAAREPSGIGKIFPLRTTVEPSNEPGTSLLRVQISAGRKLWMWGLRHTLRCDGPLLLLEQHRWTILTAPEDYSWFTSDNPAVQLGVGNDGTRNLGGGWGAQGSVLMLPLSPKHLLYTEIGMLSPEKYTVLPESKVGEIRHTLACNALRSIFASSPDSAVPLMRTRQVDAVAFTHEKQQWNDWHEHHSDAERFVDST